jgi:hypothetical protein
MGDHQKTSDRQIGGRVTEADRNQTPSAIGRLVRSNGFGGPMLDLLSIWAAAPPPGTSAASPGDTIADPSASLP